MEIYQAITSNRDNKVYLFLLNSQTKTKTKTTAYEWKRASYNEIKMGEEEENFLTHLPSPRVNGKDFPSHLYFLVLTRVILLPWLQMQSATIKG